MHDPTKDAPGTACTRPDSDPAGLKQVELNPDPPLKDYLEAMAMAKEVAVQHMDEYMLMAWYDRDRDYEVPQHASECEEECAVPGYVNYALHHGATLKVDIEKGRFVFFFTPVEL